VAVDSATAAAFATATLGEIAQLFLLFRKASGVG